MWSRWITASNWSAKPSVEVVARRARSRGGRSRRSPARGAAARKASCTAASRGVEPEPVDADCRGGAPRGCPAQRGPHSLALGRAAPVRRGGDRAVVGREADEQAVAAVALPRELADVRARRARPSRVARASPTWELCSHTTTLAWPNWRSRCVDERVERAGHVPVAEVPRRDLGAVHLLVVLLGVAHERARSARRRRTRPRRSSRHGAGRHRPAAQLEELGDDLVLARDARGRARARSRTPDLRHRRDRSTSTARGPRRASAGSTRSR